MKRMIAGIIILGTISTALSSGNQIYIGKTKNLEKLFGARWAGNSAECIYPLLKGDEFHQKIQQGKMLKAVIIKETKKLNEYGVVYSFQTLHKDQEGMLELSKSYHCPLSYVDVQTLEILKD